MAKKKPAEGSIVDEAIAERVTRNRTPRRCVVQRWVTLKNEVGGTNAQTGRPATVDVEAWQDAHSATDAADAVKWVQENGEDNDMFQVVWVVGETIRVTVQTVKKTVLS